MDDKDYARFMRLFGERARHDFATYMRLCDSSYKLGAMHRLIADELTKVENGETKRLMIETPPRFGKSREVAIEWPTYMLGRHPGHKFIVATHTNRLAQDHSLQARDRLRHPLYNELFPATLIRDDASGAKHWRTTQGGEYHTAGVTVKLSGYPADTLILDDMYADFAAANSETLRDAVQNWYESTAKTRLMPGGAIVFIGTRWNVADLQAVLTDPARGILLRERGAESLEWRVIKLPESAEEDDPLGRKVGETLCPELWSNSEMRMREAETEMNIWSALYQCRPTVLGGNYLKTQNFHENIVLAKDVPPAQRWMRYWDLAYTEKTTSDFTVGAKGCLTTDGTLYIADLIRGRWTFPEAKDRIALQSSVEKIPLGVESGGPQVAMAQELRRAVFDSIIQEIFPVGDKVARANPWAVLLQNRKIKLVDGPWVAAFIAECEAFPRGKFDDQIDAISGLFAMLKTGPAAASPPPSAREHDFMGRGSRMAV